MRGVVDSFSTASIGGWIVPDNPGVDCAVVLVQDGQVRAAWTGTESRPNVEGSLSFFFRNVPSYLPLALAMEGDDAFVSVIPRGAFSPGIRVEDRGMYLREVFLCSLSVTDLLETRVPVFHGMRRKVVDSVVKELVEALPHGLADETPTAKIIRSEERSILFEDDELRLVAVGCPDDAAVAITFYTAVNQKDMVGLRSSGALGFGETKLREMGIPALHFLHKKNHWWNSPGMREMLQIASQWTGRARRRIGYGASMGATGLLMYTDDLGLDEVLAAAPQFSVDHVDVPWERRWDSDVANVIFSGLVAKVKGNVKVYLLYDPDHELDARHAELIRSVSTGSNLLLMKVRGCGHHPLYSYQDLGLLSPLVYSFVDGHINGRIIQAHPGYTD